MPQHNNEFTLVNIDIPFWSIVFFMVKVAIASIPALFILALLSVLFGGLMGMLEALFRI